VARELTPDEVIAGAQAFGVPVMTPDGVEVVEAGGFFWLRFVSDGKVQGVTPMTPDQLIAIGNDIAAAGEIARARLRKRRAGSN
jgi:hypothetical protein